MVVVALCLAIVWGFTHTSDFRCDHLQSFTLAKPFLSWVFFLSVTVIANLALIPRAPVLIVAGILFDTQIAIVLVTLATQLAASFAFVIARYLAADWFLRRMARRPWFHRFSSELSVNSFSVVLFARLSHLFPFIPVSYACGILPLRFPAYFWGTFVGLLPTTVTFIYLGKIFGCALLEGKAEIPPDVYWKLGTVLVVLAILSLVPIVWGFAKKR